MGSRRVRICTLLLSAWAFGAWITGCSKEATAPEPTPERVNADKPNANARITSQTIFGDTDKKTDLGQVQLADGAWIGFRGTYNSSGGVGALNVGGSLRWFQAVTPGPVNVSALSGTSIVPNGLVAVGGRNTDADADFEVAFASLYSSTGSLLSEVLVTSDSSDVWFWRFAPVDDSTFIACGGERRSGVEHPLLTLLHLRAPDVLERGKTVTLLNLTGYFNDVAALPSSPGELVFSAVSRNGALGSFGGAGNIHGLRATWPGFDPVAVEWSREVIPPTGPWVIFQGLEAAGGNLYVAGIVEDHRKPPVSGGRAWYSGLVASYTNAGDLRWATTDSLTKYDEGIYSLAIGPDAVYAMGYASVYTSGANPREVFGYGMITKLDLSTGHVIANFTLGQDRYSSLLFTGAWTSSGLICGGWTEQEVSGGPYRGWLSTVDVSGTSVTYGMPAPAALRGGTPDPDAMPEPRPRWDRNLP